MTSQEQDKGVLQTDLPLEGAGLGHLKPAELTLHCTGLNVMVDQECIFKEFMLKLRLEESGSLPNPGFR